MNDGLLFSLLVSGAAAANRGNLLSGFGAQKGYAGYWNYHIKGHRKDNWPVW